MRRTFFDDDLQEALLRDGYVGVPLLDEAGLATLRDRFGALRPADDFDPPGGTPTNPTTYHCTFLDTDHTYKQAFDDLVRDTFGPLLLSLLDDYRLLTANCYVKQPGRGGFEVHQNWTLTPDPADLTVTVWVPLYDTDVANGTLAVVPGSHKLTEDVAYPRGDHYFSDYDDVIAERYYRPVAVRAGQAVVFDDNLIHGSGVNRSAAARVALQIAAIPAEADPVVWYRRPDGDFDLLSAPGSFYVDTTLAEMDRWPELFPKTGTRPYRNRRLPEEEFARRLADGPAVRSALWGWDV